MSLLVLSCRLLTHPAVPRQQGALQEWSHQSVPVFGRIPGYGDGIHPGQGKQHNGSHLLRACGGSGFR